MQCRWGCADVAYHHRDELSCGCTGRRHERNRCWGCSECEIDAKLLPDAQQLAIAIQNDRVHSEGDAAVDLRIGAVALQDVQRIRTDDAGGLIDRRYRAARAWL